MLRTSAYAELTSGAVLGEMLETDSACRPKGCCPLRYLLFFNYCQTSIAFAACCGGGSGGCYNSCGGKKRAAALIGFLRRFSMRQLQADSTLRAITNTIKAIYATSHIDGMGYRINAFCFAVLCAFLATIAFVGINSKRHDWSAAEDTQQCTYRTHRIAP